VLTLYKLSRLYKVGFDINTYTKMVPLLKLEFLGVSRVADMMKVLNSNPG
jgi:hypothetical protein